MLRMQRSSSQVEQEAKSIDGIELFVNVILVLNIECNLKDV